MPERDFIFTQPGQLKIDFDLFILHITVSSITQYLPGTHQRDHTTQWKAGATAGSSRLCQEALPILWTPAMPPEHPESEADVVSIPPVWPGDERSQGRTEPLPPKHLLRPPTPVSAGPSPSCMDERLRPREGFLIHHSPSFLPTAHLLLSCISLAWVCLLRSPGRGQSWQKHSAAFLAFGSADQGEGPWISRTESGVSSHHRRRDRLRTQTHGRISACLANPMGNPAVWVQSQGPDLLLACCVILGEHPPLSGLVSSSLWHEVGQWDTSWPF